MARSNELVQFTFGTVNVLFVSLFHPPTCTLSVLLNNDLRKSSAFLKRHILESLGLDAHVLSCNCNA